MHKSVNELKSFILRQWNLLGRHFFQLFVYHFFVRLCELIDCSLEPFENTFEHCIHLVEYSVSPFIRLWWGSNPQPPA